MKSFKLILTCTCIAIKCLAQQSERWYILSLGYNQAGYYHEAYSRKYIKSEIIINSESSFKMSLSRLGNEVDMSSITTQRENANGKLESIQSESLLSKQRTVIKASISAPLIFLTTSTGGHDVSQQVYFKGTLMGNERLRQLTMHKLKNVGDSITYQTYFPDFNMVVHCRRELASIENIEIAGKKIQSKRVKESFKGLPIERQLWLDGSGRLLKSTEPNPYGQMTIELSDKRTALEAASRTVDISMDQYANTIARSNVRLPQARQLQSITLKITLKNPEEGFPEFSGDYQQVLERNKNYVVLQITSPSEKKQVGTSFAMNKNQYLESNSFINNDDTLIVSTVKKIVGEETNQWKKAELIRNWVHSHMKFNPGIVMASSGEVIRNMEGTCISFATITATLCRAAGIPSRFLMGYVYTDGMWGGHAWAEININDQWYPIDAALTSPNIITDAARFYFVRSSMKNGPGETFLGGQQLYSNVDIDILTYKVNNDMENAGREVYNFTDSGYFNPGLKLSMKKLKGFDFSDMDKVYPENILFSLNNKNEDESIQVYQYYLSPGNELSATVKDCLSQVEITAAPVEREYKGNRAFMAITDNRIGLAIINGSEIYLITAKAKDPTALLESCLRELDFKKFPDVDFH